MTRRRALLGGAAALAATRLACRASWIDGLLHFGGSEAPADVFKGDAPGDRLWALWCGRGWAREASHYLKLGANVQCKVCPNNCILAPGDRSHCRNKVNRGGTLYTMVYGNPCTFHVDPVEKKPLFHFHPGTTAFSIATSGCVLRCLNCQNWEISQKKPEETKDPGGPELRLRPPLPSELSYGDLARLSLFPEDVVEVARALDCPSVAYTYSEPTAFYEYTRETCLRAREAGLKNIVVSCGSIEDRALRDLGQSVDAAHVDLKGFDDATYRRLNSGRLQTILDTLRTYDQMGVWFEVINLVVPTYTDDLDMIKRMCGWLVDNLGPDRPLHFSRFFPRHQLDHLPFTPVEVLLKAREIARDAGLRYVYVGNVREVADAGTTYCPNCRRAVIERDVFSVTSNLLMEGRCPFCRTAIAGVWTG